MARTSRRSRGRGKRNPSFQERLFSETDETMGRRTKSVCSEVLGEKPEVGVLRQHFAKLCKGIQNPVNLGIKLYSYGIITDAVLTRIRSIGATEKELVLLEAVRNQVAIEPEKFEVFLSLLSEEPHLSSLADSMKQQMHSSQFTDPATSQTKQEASKTLAAGHELSQTGNCSTQQHNTDRILHVSTRPEELNPEWRICQSAPESMSGGSIAVKGDSVYVNPSGSSTLYEYQSLEDKWTNKIQCDRKSFGLVVVDKLLTLVGGEIFDSSTPTSNSDDEDESACEVTNSLTSLFTEPTPKWVEHFNPMKIKRRNVVACCTPNHLVVAGGYINRKKCFYRVDYNCLEVEVMEIKTKKWNSTQQIPKQSQLVSSAVYFGNTVYLCCNSYDADSCSLVLTCSLTDLLQSCNPNYASNIIQRLIWQKLKPLSELHKPFLAHLCGILVAVGGKKQKESYRDAYEGRRCTEYSFLPAIYAYDHVEGWISLGYLPQETGFPRLTFLVATVHMDKIVVCGGDDTDCVYSCSLRSWSKFSGK